MHKLDGARDRNFWSARVSQDIRIIVHRTESSVMLAFVDHHDKAYAWAERRRIEEHPRTGAIQIVELQERIEAAAPLLRFGQEVEAEPPAEQPAAPPRPIFADLSSDELLDVGTPADWVDEIKSWTEDDFFQRSDHLPAEVTEALLDYAATGRLPERKPAEAEPLEHPDTLRRIRLIESSEELAHALDYPWDKWSVFLHPSQREVVAKDFSGPARVTGSAGTGKSIVAIHRAARALLGDPHSRVLLTTFSRPLANSLAAKMKVLLSDDPTVSNRLSVVSFEDAATDLYELAFGRRPAVASVEVQRAALDRAIADTGYSDLPARFVEAEWRHVVDGWSIEDQESYATVPRIGRRNRLGSKQRDALWPVFEKARKIISARGMLTPNQHFEEVARTYASKADKPFTHVVVDEAQDLGVSELRMMSAIAVGLNAQFFAGDIGQRIFQHPFSWLTLGVDVRGRSSNLRINYRTSRQIREAADKLLPLAVRDVDGIEVSRADAQSVFEGPQPEIHECDDEISETAIVAAFLKRAIEDGIQAMEVGVFVRAHDQLVRARQAVAEAGLECRQLSERVEDDADRVAIGTMHFAKGLEFRAVSVMACDDDVLPLQSRIDEATDEDELREVFDTERHLFYVACTRARERLHISGAKPVSEFVADLNH
ncbi:AAA family ATPase [Sphingomonas sp. NSE70-1]|uniref:DNA 3'-5' helicase n=1 Tax=Sphingomonas caseinilyticus TaxID=2908205 RepID=A0ABT0RTF2_9SPHN|nr:3'-5' exonuclease [Sphingomonas caseinilyticus]MCL6698283.1 AAA family ATPase [Sphingomonas caseinilyticus]